MTIHKLQFDLHVAVVGKSVTKDLNSQREFGNNHSEITNPGHLRLERIQSVLIFVYNLWKKAKITKEEGSFLTLR
jgi:hypothetical protein